MDTTSATMSLLYKTNLLKRKAAVTDIVEEN